MLSRIVFFPHSDRSEIFQFFIFFSPLSRPVHGFGYESPPTTPPPLPFHSLGTELFRKITVDFCIFIHLVFLLWSDELCFLGLIFSFSFVFL